MAPSKKDTSKEDKQGYQPKATARHAKMTRTKKEEIENLKQRIDTDKYLAKKYESNRKTEIKALPKEVCAAAKEELKESIAKRKESEAKDRERLRNLTREERKERGGVEKAPFNDDAWVSGGKKKGKGETPAAETSTVTAPAEAPGAPETPAEAQPAPESPPAEPEPTPAPAPAAAPAPAPVPPRAPAPSRSKGSKKKK